MHFFITSAQRLMVAGVFAVAALPFAGAGEPPLDTELLQQARAGNAKEVARLLNAGANPNATNQSDEVQKGWSALRFAIRGAHFATGGHIEVMRLLIQHGADVNEKRKDESLLWEAAGSQKPEVTKVLLEAGAKPDDAALWQASWLGRIETVKLLLDAGADPDAGMPGAAQGGHRDILRLLLAKGASVNASRKGYTGLHGAALQGGFETVRLLLERGADPNAVDSQGQTPLHMAVSDEDLRVTKALVQAGARLDHPNKEGVTPVRLAAIRGAKQTYNWLLSRTGGKEPRPVLPPKERDQSSTRDLLEILASKKVQLEDQVRAQRQLAARGKDIMPELIQSIKKHGWRPYFRLLEALGPEAAEAMPFVTAKTSDQVFAKGFLMERIKPGALAALSDEQKKQAAEDLYRAIVDPKNHEMAGWGVDMLLALGKPGAPKIVKLLRHERAGIRRATVEALLMFGRSGNKAVEPSADKEIESLLMQLTRDPDVSVKETAVAALGAFDSPSPKIKETLLTIIKNPPAWKAPAEALYGDNPWTQWRRIADQAARSLARHGPGVIDDLVPLLSPMEAPTRMPAITALKTLGAPAVPRLIELLSHKDPAVSMSASVALNDIGKPAVPSLAKALSDDKEHVVDHAANALSRIGPAAKEALPALFGTAGDEKRPDAARLAAVRAALKIAPDSKESKSVLATIPVLIRVLETGSFKHQGWAAEALGAIGPPARAALPMLRKRLESPAVNPEGLASDYVQRAAREAIASIEGTADKAPEH